MASMLGLSLKIASDGVLEYDCSRHAAELRSPPRQNLQTRKYQRLAGFSSKRFLIEERLSQRGR